MKKALLDSRDCIAWMTETLRKEAENAVDDEYNSVDLRHKLVAATYRTDLQSAL